MWADGHLLCQLPQKACTGTSTNSRMAGTPVQDLDHMCVTRGPQYAILSAGSLAVNQRRRAAGEGYCGVASLRKVCLGG